MNIAKHRRLRQLRLQSTPYVRRMWRRQADIATAKAMFPYIREWNRRSYQLVKATLVPDVRPTCICSSDPGVEPPITRGIFTFRNVHPDCDIVPKLREDRI